ncbi:nicotinamide N-methyltransferase [Pseudomassariella vexata]|uniref:Protein N-terminal and lysine N-methyltransferase EFM7 n=1 Tax=Pseudomassariella vexata TaxID=1141098 RepID=A0A1Y2DTT4_9PEZI|nr:nicotinamide N-methyltransferase [Pseudomassariella vexata]ORY62670.1 nicotinamide N-methyltransferase [Pseudomassariella vexata]
MDSDSDDDNLNATGLFQEPEGYFPPPPEPTTQTYVLQTGESLTLHLIGHHNLWGHLLWNGGRYVARWFEDHPEEVKGKTVLELGAGAGLPSLVAAVLGARKVVMSDYSSRNLVENMQMNIAEARPLVEEGRVVAEGFTWGKDAGSLLASSKSPKRHAKFDVLIQADLVFNHHQHHNLIKTTRETLSRKRESRAYVFFSSYRPWLQHEDLKYFDRAREAGFVVEKVLEEKMETPMFENDPGDVEVQKTVLGFVMRWPEGEWDEE